MAKLIVLQIIAHLLADFVFQPGKWCRSKFESGFRSKYLYLHTLVVFLCAWIFSFSFRFVWLAFVIAACHFAVDGLKSIVERAIFAKNNPDKNVRLIPVFIADQLIHLGIIVLVSYLYVTIHTLSGFSDTFRLQTLWVIMGYLICLKPSNVLIQVVLRSYSLLPEDSSADNSDLERAGRLIGNLERILAFTLVLFGQ